MARRILSVIPVGPVRYEKVFSGQMGLDGGVSEITDEVVAWALVEEDGRTAVVGMYAEDDGVLDFVDDGTGFTRVRRVR